MADIDDSLSALVDPPLAAAPSIGELEERAHRLRTRRWVGRGGAAAGAVVALIAGIVVASPGGDQTVHTAATGGGSGDGAKVAQAVPGLGAPMDLGVKVHEFEANGARWQVLAYRNEGPDICMRLAGGPEVSASVPGGVVTATAPTCFTPDGDPIEAGTAVHSNLYYLVGIAARTVTDVAVKDPAAKLELVGKDAGLPVNFFGFIIPDGPTSLTVQSTSGGRNPFSVDVPVHRRVSLVAGDVAAPRPAAPTTTVVKGEVPPTAPTVPPTTVAPPPATAPPVTSPPTTVAPIGGSPKRISVSPNVFNQNKIPFDSAGASGGQSVAVRFWAGVEPCTLLGKVDVVETATTVTITLWIGNGPELIMCTAQAVYYETIVQLSAPLGSRTIVDGAK